MEVAASRLKRLGRLLVEVGGTLSIIAVVDTAYDGLKGDEYHDRVQKTTKLHYEQAKSMLVEYESIFRRIQTNMDHHLDALTKHSKQRPRPWDELVTDLFPEAPHDDEKLLDVGIEDIFAREMETASFSERFRTVPRRQEAQLCRYHSGTAQHSNTDNHTDNHTNNTNNHTNNKKEETDTTPPSKPDKPSTTPKAPTPFGFNFMQVFANNNASLHRVEGVKELLLVLDCIAEKEEKFNKLNEEFDHNFSLLMRDVHTKVQERMTPSEAVNEELVKSVIKLVTSALFLTITRRVLFAGTSFDVASAAASALSSKARKGILAVNTFLAAIMVPSLFWLQSDLGNWLATRPFTNWIVDWIREDEHNEEEGRDEVDEEAERIIKMLLEEAPVLQRWKGCTPIDPFRGERILIYDIIQPITDLSVFYTLLWKSLSSFLPPAPSYLLTMLSYAVYRDTVEDPHRAFLKLPAIESFLHSCFVSAGLQIQYLGSSVLFPFLTLATGSFWSSMTEMTNSPEYQKEAFQAYVGTIHGMAMKDEMVFSTFRDGLTKLREINANGGKVKLPVSQLQYLDAQGELQREHKELARKVVEIFSTDYFSDHSTRRMNSVDIIDFAFAFEHYRRQCLRKLSAEERLKADTPLLGVRDDLWMQFLIHPSTVVDNAVTPAIAETAQKGFWGKASYMLNEHNKRSEEITYTLDMQRQFEFAVAIDKMFPKGASIAEFEMFFAYALSTLPKQTLENLNLNELRSSLAHWEEVSIDEFLDLIQAFSSKLLESGQNNIPNFEPELYSKFEQQLAGRRPTAAELNKLFAQFSNCLQLGSNRIATHFLHQHGLTSHRFKELTRKYSAQSEEVDRLKADWDSYFTSVKHRQKLMAAIPNIEKKRILYELMFSRQLRKRNPLAVKKDSEPSAESEEAGQGPEDNAAAEGSSDSDGDTKQ